MTTRSALLSNLNYGTIFFLMLLESTVVPVPSELVVAPAAYYAATGSINVWLVVLMATLGADVGASINYFVALYVGRPVIYRFANSRLGHLCLLNQQKVEKSERYFDDHGVAATLTGRLIPGIRHLISLPAMGWYLHAAIGDVSDAELNALIAKYNHYIVVAIVAVVVLAVAFVVIKKKRNKQ